MLISYTLMVFFGSFSLKDELKNSIFECLLSLMVQLLTLIVPAELTLIQIYKLCMDWCGVNSKCNSSKLIHFRFFILFQGSPQYSLVWSICWLYYNSKIHFCYIAYQSNRISLNSQKYIDPIL